MASTYNDLYLDLRKALKQAEVLEPAMEAKELICAVTGKNRDQFLTQLQLYVTSDTEKKVRELLARRVAGEPLPYVLGEWEFYGITLTVTPKVLIPRPDTEVLVEKALDILGEKPEGVRILDLCTGSGCVGLALAKEVPSLRAVLFDISPDALGVARENIGRNAMQGRVLTYKGNALEEPEKALGTFDIITANPPYIPSGDMEKLDASVKDYEPHLALDGGETGLDFYKTMAPIWKKALRPKGAILFEIGIYQGKDVKNILIEAGYIDVKVHRDLAGIPRVVEGHMPLTERESGGE